MKKIKIREPRKKIKNFFLAKKSSLPTKGIGVVGFILNSYRMIIPIGGKNKQNYEEIDQNMANITFIHR